MDVLGKKREKPEETSKIEVKTDSVEIQISEYKRVSIRKFKGKKMVDFREYFKKEGEFMPTKKGICFNEEQWKELKEYIQEIDEALSNI